MRAFTVAANWKMNKGPAEAADFLKAFLPKLDATGVAKDVAFRKVIFFVPAIDLWVAQQALRTTNVGWGAQNCHWEASGAFTGENSPKVIAELATPYTLVGHSERRTLFGETDEQTAKKVKTLHQFGITPMLCVGETLEERESGRTDEVIVRQLTVGLSERDHTKRVILAYEPVWAIGTGKVATPEQANEAHLVLRRAMKTIGGDTFADATPILYGGSVKPDNASQIAHQPEVDGFLVGGASLDIEPFLALCQAKN
ncbi:MAG TPA: triose-phosphate isomerase [Bdellovibrionales bacterium]|nr:triose-phosphate isomerase [Bdellovibrionales bacterium]